MTTHPDGVHVLPHERSGGWLVEAQDDGPPERLYRCVGEAELAAQHQARACGASRIFLHDRYHRVRAIRTRAL